MALLPSSPPIYPRGYPRVRFGHDGAVGKRQGREAGYPSRLRRLRARAPAAVWWRGALPPAGARAALVVGSRSPTPEGTAAAQRAVEAAVRAGLVVVSGLSPGVDAVAHVHCLALGGTAVAVVAGGPDRFESARLARLADGIVAAGGAVLSEYPPGTPVTPAGRVARCRLQVALCDEVLVAAVDGPRDGTMNAIRAAGDLGIPVVLLDPPGSGTMGW